MEWRTAAVHCNIANRLRGTRPIYAAQVEDEEVTSPQPKKHHKAVIYTQAGFPAEDLLPMLFVNGYLEVLAMVKDDTKELMLSHLQELMADWETYGWPVVLAYYAGLASAS